MSRSRASRRFYASGSLLAMAFALSGCSDEPSTPIVDAGVDAPVPECAVAADCPGADADCQTRTCIDGVCGLASVAEGTPVAAQIPGDCRVQVCDGKGAVVSQIDDGDLPPSEGPCKTPTCEAGNPILAHKKDGLPCEDADACTVLDHCQFGVCIGGGPLECTGGSSCSAGVCAAPQCSGSSWFGGPPLSFMSPDLINHEPFMLAGGDLNGDGDVDLAVMNTTRVELLLGDGKGTFSIGATLSDVQDPTAVATVDVNGDGHLDLAITSYAKLFVFTNAGDGSFSSGTSYTTGGATTQIGVADLDNDAKPDLAVLHQNGISVFLNQGGTLGPEIPVPIGPETGGLAMADVNGDALVDLVSSYHLPFDNRVEVMLNQGNGSFVAGGDYPSHGLGTASFVSLVDIDDDGALDILSTTIDGTRALLNDGNGSFIVVPQGYALEGKRVVVADTNHFGGPELFFYGGVSNMTFATKSDGFSPFWSAEIDILAQWHAIAADVNGDGWDDIVVGNPVTDEIEVLLNDKGGWFFRPTTYAGGVATYPPSQPGALVARDFNGDGKPDVAITNLDRDDVTVLLSDDQGKLDGQPNYSYPVGQGPAAIAAEDLNGDGRIDLAVGNQLGEDLSVLLNQGDGKFYLSPAYALGFSPSNLVIADSNKDEKPDLIVAGSANFVTLVNQGDGTFGAPVDTGVFIFINSLATADLNGDGRPDFVGGNDIGNDLWVITSQPDGSLADPVKIDDSCPVGGVDAADLDGDGWPELVAGCGAGVSVFRNMGNGTFAAPVDHPLPFWPQTIAVADLDMDGQKDVAAETSIGESQVMILSNTGAATLQYAGSFFAGRAGRSVVAADMNADGRPDLITAGTDPTGNARVNILFNACQP